MIQCGISVIWQGSEKLILSQRLLYRPRNTPISLETDDSGFGLDAVALASLVPISVS